MPLKPRTPEAQRAYSQGYIAGLDVAIRQLQHRGTTSVPLVIEALLSLRKVAEAMSEVPEAVAQEIADGPERSGPHPA